MNTKNASKSFAAIATAFALTLGSPSLQADDKEHKHEDHHGHHHHGVVSGPNGGRVLHEVEPHLEFFVTEDRKVQITALGEDGKAIPIEDQVVRITGGSRANPTRMKLKKQGDILVSDEVLPEGNDFPVVIQIKLAPLKKGVIEKFNLDLNQCPTCDNREYACACDHHSHEDHDHGKEKKN